MSDEPFLKRTLFEFGKNIPGRVRHFWHHVSGRWVEIHQNEQQTVINKRLYEQQLDLADLLARHDRETTKLKKMVAMLSTELSDTRQRLAILEQERASANDEA